MPRKFRQQKNSCDFLASISSNQKPTHISSTEIQAKNINSKKLHGISDIKKIVVAGLSEIQAKKLYVDFVSNKIGKAATSVKSLPRLLATKKQL